MIAEDVKIHSFNECTIQALETYVAQYNVTMSQGVEWALRLFFDHVMRNDPKFPIQVQLHNLSTLEETAALFLAWSKAKDAQDGYALRQAGFTTAEDKPLWLITGPDGELNATAIEQWQQSEIALAAQKNLRALKKRMKQLGLK